MNETIVSFLVILLSGVALKLLTTNPDTIKDSINIIVIKILLPALCIKTFSTNRIDISILLVPASAWVIIISSTALGFLTLLLIKRFLSLDDSEKGVLILVSSFGNLIYLGVPILNVLYGESAITYGIIYDLLAGTILAWTLGAFIASYYGDRKAFSLTNSLKTILTLPPLWGIFIGICLNVLGIQLPQLIKHALNLLSGGVTPLMIMSIGLSLTLPNVKHTLALLPFISIKLVVSPLIAFYVSDVIGLQSIARKSTIMESAMPVMILLLMISNRFRLNEPLTAFAITMSTVLSFITLPILSNILERAVK